MKGRITKTGYRRNSPDVGNDFNIIPSNRISMRDVDFPVLGIDNLGNTQLMHPGGEYEYQGDYVTELPMYGSGGLTQWFAEEWVDIKTGKKCGRSGKDKKGRPYPACRPSKRVNKTTPKTKGEMSAAEKAKFKRKKKSGKRIDYNHKRAQEGTEVPLNRSEIFNIPRSVRYENSNMVLQDKPIWDGFLDEVTVTPTTASEYAWQENRANQATGGLDPIYPVFELLSMGTGTAYRTGAGALARNTGKKQVMTLADHIIPGYQKGAKAYAKSMKVPSGANMNIADDVWSSGTLYGKGTSFQKQEALDRIANFQKDLSPVPFTHVHGTGANALEGIFKNKGLRPSSELQKSGDLVTGEILIKQSVAPELFKSGQSAVSAASIANPRAAAQYALDYGKGAGNYPVVFGINPRVGAQSRMSIPFNSSVQGETLFRNGIGFDEISNIFVPDAQRAAFMQNYGNQLGSIKLGSFDDYVNQAQALSGRAKMTSAKNYLYQKGGSLPSYQTRGEVNSQNLDPRLQNGYNSTDATYVRQEIVDPYIVNRSETQRLQDEYVPQKVSQFVPPSKVETVLNRLANPATTAGYIVRGETMPTRINNIDKENVYDYASDIINPASWLNYAWEAGKDITQGDYIGAASNALGAIPTLPAGSKGAKFLTNEVVDAAVPVGNTIASGAKTVGNRVVDAATLPKLKRNYTNINTSLDAALNEKAIINENYGRLTNSYIKKANNRYNDYENFRSRSLNTSQIYNDYLDRRIPLLTNFPTRSAWINSGDVLVKRLERESFLRNTAKDFEIDPFVKGFKPKSATSPLFKDVNLNSDIQDLSTGRIQNFRITPPQVGGTGFKLQNNRVVPNVYPTKSNLVVPQEARSIVGNNISLLENNIPGFKVLGSSRGFADAGLPTFPKDYDGVMSQNAYEKYVKNQYPILDQSGLAKKHSVTFNKNAKHLDIDFNIVEQGSNGKAKGRLAEQLYRKLDPDNYFKQSEAVISGNQSNINIPFTPEELIAKTDFTKQSVADAFEISIRKPKHINRPDLYLSYGDGNKVLESQKAYAQSLIGSKAYLPPQYPASEFADVAKNKALLQDMRFAGDIESAAADPARMQAALNDFYFSNTTLSRGIDDYNLDGATPRTGFTEWNPEAGGGSHSGAGLNNTLLGDSGYGNLYSHKQFKLNLNSSDPSSLVKDVNRLNFEQNLTPSELEAASEVLMRYNLPSHDIQTKADFLKRVTPAGPEGLLEYNKITGAKYIPGNEFSESMYVGSANVFNPAEDLISMGYKNPILSGSIPTGKSWMVRQRNTLSNLDYPHVETMLGLNADEYSLLYNRLNTPDGAGIEKAIKRAKNQPGEYNDAMIQSWERRGELPYQQKINYNIELNDVSKRISDLQDASKKYYYRIDDAERLQPTLIGLPMGLGVSAGFYNLAYGDAAEARKEERRREVKKVKVEDEKAIQQALDLGVPDQYLNRAFPASAYERYKEREDFINEYEGLVPLELNGRVFMVPPQYKKEYQDGGEKSTREKSNEKYGKSNTFSQYVSNPTRIRVVEEAERLDDTPRSTTGVRDDLTANYINQTIYGNPATTPLKLAALQETKDWTFENIRPVQYPSIFNYIASAGNAVAGKLGITEGNAPPARDSEGDLMIDEEMYAKVMGVPHKSKYISESKYKPSKAKDSDAKYYTINWNEMIDKDKLIDYAVENKLMKGDKMVVNSLAPFLKPGYMPEEEFKNIDPLQNFTIGIGEDDKGRYLSVYDKYDFNKTFNTVTSPFEIYDRFYLYEEGGESIPVYNTYKTKNRAWLAARKNLGAGRTFMYGGKVYSTSTPKGL